MSKITVVTICALILNVVAHVANGETDRLELSKGHPRPSYANIEDIDAMAAALRQSAPAMQRGAWEWERWLFISLVRFITGEFTVASTSKRFTN